MHTADGVTPPDVPQGQRAGRDRDPRDPGADAGRDRVRRGGGRGRVHRRAAAPVRDARGADERRRRSRKVLPKVCVSREFTTMATGQTSPVAGWLRSLARSLHEELGGPGVGALGMCFTGGFALAMMVDTSVVAPVLAQPSLPFPVGKKRAADLNLSPADLAVRPRPRRRRLPGARPALPRRPADRHPLRHAHPRDRRRVHPRRVRRQGPLDADRAPAAGGRRPGARVLRREAAPSRPALDRRASGQHRHSRSRPNPASRTAAVRPTGPARS